MSSGLILGITLQREIDGKFAAENRCLCCRVRRLFSLSAKPTPSYLALQTSSRPFNVLLPRLISFQQLSLGRRLWRSYSICSTDTGPLY